MRRLFSRIFYSSHSGVVESEEVRQHELGKMYDVARVAYSAISNQSSQSVSGVRKGMARLDSESQDRANIGGWRVSQIR